MGIIRRQIYTPIKTTPATNVVTEKDDDPNYDLTKGKEPAKKKASKKGSSYDLEDDEETADSSTDSGDDDNSDYSLEDDSDTVS